MESADYNLGSVLKNKWAWLKKPVQNTPEAPVMNLNTQPPLHTLTAWHWSCLSGFLWGQATLCQDPQCLSLPSASRMIELALSVPVCKQSQ